MSSYDLLTLFSLYKAAWKFKEKNRQGLKYSIGYYLREYTLLQSHKRKGKRCLKSSGMYPCFCF